MKHLLALAAAGAACLLSACANQPAHDGATSRDRGFAASNHNAIHAAPPAPRQEAVATIPGPPALYSWDPGHWRWAGSDYEWSSGRWMKRPYVNAEWVPARWENRRGDWVLVDGHWA